MCGIAGLFLPREAELRTPDLDAMAAAMRHRGPDGEGRHVSADRRFQAVFRRLAIIDIAGGDQPIVENGGERVLMGNGEIYNYLELRAEEPDYPYRTVGDIEVVLPLARRHGEAFVQRLNGIYGLALYERAEHRLLLVRDRLGVKPLYWTAIPGGGVLFASEIKALMASGLVEPAIDEDAVAAYLAHGYVPGPATLFRGVRKLPAGHLLRADASGGVTIERYWRPKPAADLPGDAEGIRRHLTALMEDAARLQLRSDVPVGALLSGGIDSGLVVAMASRQSSRPLDTYTVSFEGATADEAPLAAEVALRYGTRHTAIRLPAARVADHLPRLAWFAEEPLNDAALLPNAMIEEVLGSHATVALNGTGGDELFAGYGRYFQLPVEARYLGLPRFLRQGLIEPALRLVSPMTAWRLARAGKWEADRGGYLHDHTTHFPPPMLRILECGIPSAPSAPARHFAEFDGPAQSAALYADIHTYLPEDLLTLLDRTSMAYGVEGRVPLLDHRLVEAALAVPPEVRTPGGRQKGLERAIAADLLPDSVLRAPKRGFASPVPAWIRAGLGPVALRLLTRPRTLERGWWTKAGIARLLARPERDGFRIYSLLMLELAARLFVEMPAGTDAPSASLEDLADGG